MNRTNPIKKLEVAKPIAKDAIPAIGTTKMSATNKEKALRAQSAKKEILSRMLFIRLSPGEEHVVPNEEKNHKYDYDDKDYSGFRVLVILLHLYSLHWNSIA